MPVLVRASVRFSMYLLSSLKLELTQRALYSRVLRALQNARSGGGVAHGANEEIHTTPMLTVYLDYLTRRAPTTLYLELQALRAALLTLASMIDTCTRLPYSLDVSWM